MIAAERLHKTTGMERCGLQQGVNCADLIVYQWQRHFFIGHSKQHIITRSVGCFFPQEQLVAHSHSRFLWRDFKD